MGSIEILRIIIIALFSPDESIYNSLTPKQYKSRLAWAGIRGMSRMCGRHLFWLSYAPSRLLVLLIICLLCFRDIVYQISKFQNHVLSGDVENDPRVHVFEAQGVRWKRLRTIASSAFSAGSLKKVRGTCYRQTFKDKPRRCQKFCFKSTSSPCRIVHASRSIPR